MMAQDFDKELLDRVDALSPDELLSFKQVCPVDLKHYMFVQRAWIEEDIYYLGCELCCKPSASQIAERILTGRQSRRFRAYYALRYPDMVSCPESFVLMH
ncbi:MAG: hypothetical protein JW942_03805 [Opitutales bacterium]|nr:hypothetical protein [Opitutales bacterium]